MWPKLLLEMLPHVTRLVPLADRYFSSRGDQDKAHAAALASLSEEVRGGLSRVDEVHAGLQQELKAQGEQITQVQVEVRRAWLVAERVEQQVMQLERTTATTRRIAMATLGLLGVVLVLVVVVLVKMTAR